MMFDVFHNSGDALFFGARGIVLRKLAAICTSSASRVLIPARDLCSDSSER